MSRKKTKAKKRKRNVGKRGPAQASPALSIEETLRTAVARHQAGDAAAARELYRRILRERPRHADAAHLLGVAEFQAGNLDAAERCIRQALEVREEAVYHGNFGNVLKAKGQTEAALAAYRRAVEMRPDLTQPAYNLGVLLQEMGRGEEAAAAFQKVLEIDPEYVQAYNNLGNLYRSFGDVGKAIASFRKAAEIDPTFAEAYNNLGNIHKDRGETEKAVAYYEKAAKARPDFVQVYVNMGNTLVYDQRRLDQADLAFRKVRQLEPENEWAVAGLAKVMMRRGEMEGAYRLMKPAVDRGSRNIDIAITFSEVAGKFDDLERSIAMMEEMIDSGRYKSDQVRHLHYNLGDVYDEAGEYDKAFHHYKVANDSRPITFDLGQFEQRLGNLERVFSPGYGKRLAKAVNASEVPVFIVGMPRSGTSLVEQIVSSHSQCYGAGELPYIPRIIHALNERLKGTYPVCLHQMPRREADVLAQGLLRHFRQFDKDALRICDKMPQNFLHLGLISLLMPKARIIHCARDPRDTGLSIFFQNFSDGHPYAVDLKNIGIYYRGYRRIMAHWEKALEMPMLTVQYEELIADQERVSRQMLEFLGLEWEDRCLQFYKARRSVSTASFHQVRQPIYKKSLARWQRYEKHIDPMVEEIREFLPENRGVS
jgi:tetratricopeptide (TPR) repeat protein